MYVCCEVFASCRHYYAILLLMNAAIWFCHYGSTHNWTIIIDCVCLPDTD